MTIKDLQKQKCAPCRKGTAPLSMTEARKRLPPLRGWSLTGRAKGLSKEYVMKDFKAAVAYINAILPVAQAEDHHPDVHLTGYRKLRIALSTHEIGGLSENDFILAAKIELLPKKLKAARS